MEGIARVHLDDGGPADLHREIRSDTVGILWVLNRGRTRQVCPGPWCFCVMLAVAITSRGTHGCACNKVLFGYSARAAPAKPLRKTTKP